MGRPTPRPARSFRRGRPAATCRVGDASPARPGQSNSSVLRGRRMRIWARESLRFGSVLRLRGYRGAGGTFSRPISLAEAGGTGQDAASMNGMRRAGAIIVPGWSWRGEWRQSVAVATAAGKSRHMATEPWPRSLKIGGRYDLSTVCIGVGQKTAVVIERV